MIILDSSGRDLVQRPPRHIQPLLRRSIALALASVLLSAAPRPVCCGAGYALAAVAPAAPLAEAGPDAPEAPAADADGEQSQGPAGRPEQARAGHRRQVPI